MSRRIIFAAAFMMAIQAIPVNAATFLFIRHAESTSNAGTVTTTQEALDPPLTEKGKEQALALKKVLAEQKITAIYTSALQRTQLTIAPTAEHFGLTPIIDARTNEWHFGDIKNLGERDNARISATMKSWAAGDTGAKPLLPNAESLNDMVARVIPAWTEITDAHKHEDGVIVLVGHGAEIGYVMPYFAKNASLAFAAAHGLHNTGIVQVEIVDDEPVVITWQGVPAPKGEPELAQ